jgi:hypothetical protein
MEYREKISYLESYMLTLDQEVDLHDQIVAARDTATIHGMQITDGIHSNDVHSAVENASIRIEDLQIKYDKTVAERKAISNHIEQAAKSMSNKRLAQLIINKYVNLWSDSELRRWMQVGKTGLSQCIKNGAKIIEL